MHKNNFNIQTWVPVEQFANVVHLLRSKDVYNGSSTSEVLRTIIGSFAASNDVFSSSMIPEAMDYLQSQGFRLGQLRSTRGINLVKDISSCLDQREQDGASISERAAELEHLSEANNFTPE